MDNGRAVLAVAVDVVIGGGGQRGSGVGLVGTAAPTGAKDGSAVVGTEDVVGGLVDADVGQRHGDTGGAALHAGAGVVTEGAGGPVCGIEVAVAADLGHIANGAAGNGGRIAVLNQGVRGIDAGGGCKAAQGQACNARAKQHGYQQHGKKPFGHNLFLLWIKCCKSNNLPA